MTRAIIAIGLLAFLTGCATHSAPDQVTGTIEKDIPVATPCAVSAGPAPDFADSDFAIAATPKGDIFDLARLYAAGRQQRIAYIAALEAANAGCSPKP